MPIDINLLRVDAGGDPEKVKKSERDRFRDDSIVDQIIEIDNKWRKCKFQFPISHFFVRNIYSDCFLNIREIDIFNSAVRRGQSSQGLGCDLKDCGVEDEGVQGR